MPGNMVVVHYKEGKIIKGTIADFLPKKTTFHLIVGGMLGEEVKEISVNDLKAVFFVKSFDGHRHYDEIKDFSVHPIPGKSIKVLFEDEEVIFGYTHVINYEHPGFFIIPADPTSNNERIFVVFSALKELEVDGSRIDLQKMRLNPMISKHL